MPFYGPVFAFLGTLEILLCTSHHFYGLVQDCGISRMLAVDDTAVLHNAINLFN